MALMPGDLRARQADLAVGQMARPVAPSRLGRPQRCCRKADGRSQAKGDGAPQGRVAGTQQRDHQTEHTLLQAKGEGSFTLAWSSEITGPFMGTSGFLHTCDILCAIVVCLMCSRHRPERTARTDILKGDLMARRSVCLVAAVALLGCRDASGPSAVPLSASVSGSPAANAMGVARGDSIRVVFGVPVDSASCVAAFRLRMVDSTGALVAGRMHFSDGYRQMMFVPDSMLGPGTRYFAHLRDSMMTRSSGGSIGGGMGSMDRGSRYMMFDQPPAGCHADARRHGLVVHDGELRPSMVGLAWAKAPDARHDRAAQWARC